MTNNFADAKLVDAAANGDAGAVKRLLDDGAGVKNDKGSTTLKALHYAAYAGHVGIVALLGEKGADINADMGGWTILMDISGLGDLGMVAFLVGKGADVNTRGKNGVTALQFAVAGADGDGDNLKVAKFLLEAGAKPMHRKTALKCLNYVRNEKKREPLAELFAKHAPCPGGSGQ